MASALKTAFVTIGQSPRTDVVPEMLATIGEGLAPSEVGVLDGLDREAIAALAPREDEPRLVTRLRDGSEVVISREQTRQRLQALLDDLHLQGFDLVVLLCTGYFEGLHARTLFVEAQRAVDHTVEAICEPERTVGVLVPLAKQMAEFHAEAYGPRRVLLAHASPYSEDRFAEAAARLREADVVVMHCMGYTEAMRRHMAELTGRPVLLARRMVAAMVAQLI